MFFALAEIDFLAGVCLVKRILVCGIAEEYGGVESFLFNIISQAQGEDIAFDLLLNHKGLAFRELYEQMGTRIYTITARKENPLQNKRDLEDFFSAHAKDYAAVWCNQAELINIDILKQAKRFGVPMRVVHTHSNATTRGRLITMLHYLNKLFIGSVATDYWGCSRAALEWFYSKRILKSEKCRVIKDAIRTERYALDLKARDEIRREYGLENSFAVSYCGRIDIQQKNILFLAEIFAEIKKLVPNAKLFIVGDGPEREAFLQKAAELGVESDVVITGFKNDVNRYYSAMDVMLLPSHFESFGMVLIEAQCSGLRCFTSLEGVPKDAGITELVEYLPLKNSAAEWAAEIAKAKDYDRVDRTEDIADAGFSVEREAQRIKGLFGE